MSHTNGQRRPLRWATAFILVAAGFIGGLVVSTGDGSDAGGGSALLEIPAAMAAQSAAQGLSSADVAEIAMPAVVNISTDKVADGRSQHPFFNDPFFRRFFEMPDDETHRDQERIEQSLGSGIVISDDGYILTNNHVVERATKIRVSFASDEVYEAEVVGTDPQTDVALIKIDADGLAYLRLADSDHLRVGDEVMAIGNPFGVGQTVTKGIVSAKGRSIGLINYEDLIQTDATINPGNSGGALVNMNAEVVGMNTAILSRSGGSQGIGFAISSNMAKDILSRLREDGAVTRAYLGVTIQPVNQSMADALGMDKPRGVMIDNVNEDTPAEKAGLREGDVVLSVDGKRVDSNNELRNKISLSAVGHEADLRIVRDGKERSVSVKLAALPDQDQLASTSTRSHSEDDEGIEGVTVRELTERVRASASIPDDIEGVLVVEVNARSNAQSEGLARGDVIIEVNKGDISDLDDYRKQVQKNEDKPVLLRVFRPGRGRLFIAVPR